MGSYIFRRFWHSLPVLFGISLIVFTLRHLCGDPAVLMLPPDVTKEDIDNFGNGEGFDAEVGKFSLERIEGDNLALKKSTATGSGLRCVLGPEEGAGQALRPRGPFCWPGRHGTPKPPKTDIFQFQLTLISEPDYKGAATPSPGGAP